MADSTDTREKKILDRQDIFISPLEQRSAPASSDAVQGIAALLVS
jgi:hypothetical protein